jgi:hypothetical protein
MWPQQNFFKYYLVNEKLNFFKYNFVSEKIETVKIPLSLKKNKLKLFKFQFR